MIEVPRQAAEVVVPSSAEEAVSAFGDGDGTTVLAGGTIVMVELVHGRLSPSRVLMLERAGLTGLARDGERLTIGSMTPVAELNAALPTLREVKQRFDPHRRMAPGRYIGGL